MPGFCFIGAIRGVLCFKRIGFHHKGLKGSHNGTAIRKSPHPSVPLRLFHYALCPMPPHSAGLDTNSYFFTIFPFKLTNLAGMNKRLVLWSIAVGLIEFLQVVDVLINLGTDQSIRNY